MTTEKLGRPTKFTDEVVNKLCHAIKIGATIEIACDYAGISETCFYEWQQNGRNGDETYADFSEKIKSAKGNGAISWLEVIENAMPKEWTAAAWKLERRYFKDYSNNVVVRSEYDHLVNKVDDLAKKLGVSNESEKAKELDQGSDQA